MTGNTLWDNIYFWEGVGREDRLNPQLLPENVEIDNLSRKQLIYFSALLSASIRFYETTGKSNTTWDRFYLKDNINLLYWMAGYGEMAEYIKFTDGINDLSMLDPGQFRTKLAVDQSQLIVSITQLGEFWRQHLSYNENTIEVIFFLNKLTETPFREQVVSLIGFSDLLNFPPELTQSLKTLADTWGIKPGTEPPDLYVLNKTLVSISKVIQGVFGTVIQKANDVLTYNVTLFQNVKPQSALFLSFIELYKRLQQEINKLTGRHLDFYFEKVLRQARSIILPDETVVCLDLSKGLGSATIETGTAFPAGKGKDGNPVLFVSKHVSVVNNTKVDKIKRLFVSTNPLNYSGLDKRIITDIFADADTPKIAEGKGWKMFGEDQFFKSENARTMENGRLGFLITSNALILSEGDREISIELICSPDSFKLFCGRIEQIEKNPAEKEHDTFDLMFRTGIDLHITLDGKEQSTEHWAFHMDIDKQALILTIELDRTDPPVAPLKVPIPGQPETKSPYVRLSLRDESHIYLYPFLSMLEISNVAIRTHAGNIKNLILSNGFGPVKPDEPFHLFGPTAEPGSYVVLRHPETFSKKLSGLSIGINWHQLPENEGGLGAYFSVYGKNIQNSDYLISLAYLSNGDWIPANLPPYQLFSEQILKGIRLKRLADSTNLGNIKPHKINYAPDLSLSNKPFTGNSLNGFLKIQLIGPAFAFGQKDYSTVLSRIVTHNSRLKDQSEALPEPSPPFSPMAGSITLSYTADVNMVEEEGVETDVRLFQLSPFGYKDATIRSAYATSQLLEHFDGEGHLYLGLSEIPENRLLNLFIKMYEGTVYDYLRPKTLFQISFLKQNTWEWLDTKHILHNTTGGFMKSGVLIIRLPDDLTTDDTLIAEQLYWIRLSVPDHAEGCSRVMGIYENAVELVWDGQGDPARLNEPLPENTIHSPAYPDKRIKKVIQPIESTGGKGPDNTEQFYIRVSERLRHKNRASCIWDYEHLVIEHFPQVRHAKCFTPNIRFYHVSDPESQDYIKPGTIKIVVVADTDFPEVRNKLRPKISVGRLKEIKDFLKSRSAAFLDIDVSNPFYERIRVICKVKFKNTTDNPFNTEMLNQAIMTHISPAFDQGSDIRMGKNLYVTEIMAFVQSLPYIDFVTGFSVVKTYEREGQMHYLDSAESDTDEIKPLYAWSILTSVEHHDISVIDTENYEPPSPRGIGNMKINTDMIIKG